MSKSHLANIYGMKRQMAKKKMAEGGKVEMGPMPDSHATIVDAIRARRKASEQPQVDIDENEEEQPSMGDEMNMDALKKENYDATMDDMSDESMDDEMDQKMDRVSMIRRKLRSK